MVEAAGPVVALLLERLDELHPRLLRSMTGGQGLFTMEFDHYEEAPPPVAEKVMAEYRKDKGED